MGPAGDNNLKIESENRCGCKMGFYLKNFQDTEEGQSIKVESLAEMFEKSQHAPGILAVNRIQKFSGVKPSKGDIASTYATEWRKINRSGIMYSMNSLSSHCDNIYSGYSDPRYTETGKLLSNRYSRTIFSNDQLKLLSRPSNISKRDGTPQTLNKISIDYIPENSSESGSNKFSIKGTSIANANPFAEKPHSKNSRLNPM